MCFDDVVSNLRFPILRSHLSREDRDRCPASVPWEFVSPYEERARLNHDQSLVRLAERGGLSPGELWCLVNDTHWQNMPPSEASVTWLVEAMRAQGKAA